MSRRPTKATPLRPLVRFAAGQGAHMPPAVRRSYQERAARAVYRECLERALRDPVVERSSGCGAAGWHASSCCSGNWVGAAVYPHRIGMAIVRVCHRGQEQVRATTSRDELELLGGFRWRHFARVAAAKKALLGMLAASEEELVDCRLLAVAGPCGVVLVHRGEPRYVHQTYRRGHYAALCADRSDRAPIRWDWREAAEEAP